MTTRMYTSYKVWGREFWIIKAQGSRSWSRSRDTGLQLGNFLNRKTLGIVVMSTIKGQLKQKRPKRLCYMCSIVTLSPKNKLI